MKPIAFRIVDLNDTAGNARIVIRDQRGTEKLFSRLPRILQRFRLTFEPRTRRAGVHGKMSRI